MPAITLVKVHLISLAVVHGIAVVSKSFLNLLSLQGLEIMKDLITERKIFMEEYVRLVQIRWSDLDPNFHLRHSVYYDWGAYCRIEFLNDNKLTTEVMKELKIGPILFREECVFRREILSGDEVSINLKLIKARKDFSRWSVQHQIIKGKGVVSAVLTVDGAWLNMIERKLGTPPQQVFDVFSAMPKDEAFQWL